MDAIGYKETKEAQERQLLSHIFDILAQQGLLTADESYRLKLELADGKQKRTGVESRNI